MKHVMTGECDYPGKGIITDEQVWQLVKKHSRLTDRINSRKMVEMTIAAQLILFGIYESECFMVKKASFNMWELMILDGKTTKRSIKENLELIEPEQGSFFFSIRNIATAYSKRDESPEIQYLRRT